LFNIFDKILNKKISRTGVFSGEMKASKQIAVIGSGVSSLCAAATLGAAGHKVSVFEKNEQLGGRLRQFSEKGFVFDMGPSWYWMPDVFEKFYNRFGHTTADFYNLVKLDPGFQVIYKNSETLKIPAGWDALQDLFENVERGSADKLKKFIEDAEYKYKVGINDLVYKPGLSLLELVNPETIKGVFKLQLFYSFSKHVRKYFRDERLIALMEFPVLFLGAMPRQTPALYSLMNYAGLRQGTYYPMGGFAKIVEAMEQIARENHVTFNTAEPVRSLTKSKGLIGMTTSRRHIMLDGVIAGADYHHVESELLKAKDRNYSETYWDQRVLAPSCLLFYIGVSKKIQGLEHHNLFFDEDLEEHALEIYETPSWPVRPLFYVCCPSKTDPGVAPEGKENLFILMPLAPGLDDSEATRQLYFSKLLGRLEAFTKTDIRKDIEYSRSYCVSDFVSDYNSYKGNAYGLANTLRQTANLKPSIRNKKIDNFYYTGQLTVPGPGVPPAIISGQVAANQLIQQLNKQP
jgi:phytoene desaturase